MDLSPNDIRNYEFPNQMRGYDKEEVDNLLEQVAAAMEEARQENLKLSMEADSLRTQVSALKEFEDTIKNAAIDARRNADATVSDAKHKAEEVLARAKEDALGVIEAQEKEIAHVKEQLASLEQVKKSYISELRSLINSHMEMVDEIATADIKKDIHGDADDEAPTPPPPPELEKHAEPSQPAKPPTNGIEVTESTDVTRQSVETLASAPGDGDNAPEEASESGGVAAAEKAVEDSGQIEEAPPEEDKPVDPELAAALERYRAEHAGQPAPSEPKPEKEPVPPQGTLVETNRSAEDIPPGFIGKVADVELKTGESPKKATAKAGGDAAEDGTDTESPEGLAPDAQDAPTEHNTIDMDRTTDEDKARQKVSPDELAEALDKVVSKFEEELDKAEKS